MTRPFGLNFEDGTDRLSRNVGNYEFTLRNIPEGRSQWPRGLRRRPAAARLLTLWVRFPPGAWMSVCCVFSGRGLCDELITRPEGSYRLWCVVVCDLETWWMRRPWPTGGLSRQEQTNKTFQKSQDLIYIEAKACNHCYSIIKVSTPECDYENLLI